MSAFDPSRTGYKCPKCGTSRYETGQLRAAGGFWSKIFDVQHRKFTTVTCEHCKYTEIYKVESGKLESIFDLFTG